MRRERLVRRRLRAHHEAKRRGGLPKLLIAGAMGILLFFTALAGSGIAASAYVAYVGSRMETPQERLAMRGGGARIFDRNGVLLYQFLDEREGYREPVTLDQISPFVLDATVAAEDASFYDNSGLNVRGIARAAVENFASDDFLGGSGGSSITQQLAKQLYFTQEQREARSVQRKMREAAIALQLTRDYEKDQILEWYLNEIPYGGIMVGVQAAAQGYFGVDARDVTLAQAAFLAGLPQSPSRYDPFTNFDAAIARQHEVLDLMVHHGKIDQQTADWAKLEVIQVAPRELPFHAPHFVQYVGDYIRSTLGEEALNHGGIDVITTLDLGMQWTANAALEKYVSSYERQSNGHNGAVVIMEPPTGQILAMVGSRDYFRDDVQGRVNNAIAQNSPGSTLKPFTYATAFMQGWGPEWPIIDTAIKYREADGKEFSPRNPDGRMHGTITAKAALGNSYNIPAFKTILWTGTETVVATAKAMGLTTLDRGLGPALTLGGADITLLDQVYAYSTFANNGVMIGAPTVLDLPAGNRALDPIAVQKVTNRRGDVLLDNTVPDVRVAMEPEYAYMITSILSEDANRSATYGRGSNLNIAGHRVAVKTGTSEPYEDNRKLIGDTWTIGYTPDIAVGVWAGNSDNTPMTGIFSTTIAGATWHDVMTAVLAGRPARDWIKPAGVVTARVCVPSGYIAEGDTRCRSVEGEFALQSLRRPDVWGGTALAPGHPPAGPTTIPVEITGWKRYLADEYMRSSRPSPPRRTPAPTPTPAAQPPPDPGERRDGDEQREDDRGGGENGNGRGNGRR